MRVSFPNVNFKRVLCIGVINLVQFRMEKY